MNISLFRFLIIMIFFLSGNLLAENVLKPFEMNSQLPCVVAKSTFEYRLTAIVTAGAPSRTAYSPHRTILPGAVEHVLYDSCVIPYLAVENIGCSNNIS